MDILPPQLIAFIAPFRPLMRKEVFDTFKLLVTGLLIGEAKAGAVRASVLAGGDFQPQRVSDFFCRHRISPQALMAHLVAALLRALYSEGLPARLFWIADSTTTEKPYAECVASVGLFHRTKRLVGRAQHLQGHCYVAAAHLHQQTVQGLTRWASYLCGALLYVKGRSIPELVGALATQLRLPPSIRHVWVVDRGILSRTLLRALAGVKGVRARAGAVQRRGLLRPAPPTPQGAQEGLRREVPRRPAAARLPGTVARPRDEAQGARQRARAQGL